MQKADRVPLVGALLEGLAGLAGHVDEFWSRVDAARRGARNPSYLNTKVEGSDGW